MIESLTLALVLTASPAEPVAAPVAPVVASDMTPEQRRKRAARIAAAKKQKQNEARKKAAARKAAANKKKAGKTWKHESGMMLVNSKPGAVKTRQGPNVKQTKPGKSHVRKDVESPAKKGN